jgi:hypothetical protein
LVLAAAGASCSDGVAPDPQGGLPLLFSVHVPAAASQAEVDALAAAFDLVDTYHVMVQDSATGTPLAGDTVTVASGQVAHEIDLALPAATVGLRVLVTVVGLDNDLELYRTATYLSVQDAANPTPVPLQVRYTGPGVRGRITNATGVALADVDVDLMQGNSLIQSATTEPDGTYLFVGATTGLYQVVPTPPPSQFVCPGSRNVNLASATTSVVADFATRATACQTRLLILGGGDLAFHNDTATVRAHFTGVPNLTTSSFYFVNNLPGLAFLRQFDVVLLFANGQFNQSSALGSQVAQYAQVGGNVVFGSFYWQDRSDSNLGAAGWGTLETLDPLESLIGPSGQGGATYQADSLNVATMDTNHLLTAGLTRVTSTGFRGGAQAVSGTTVVASWTDGTAFIAHRVLPWGSRMVGVTLFPASGAAASGDVATLWRNAVLWAGAAGGPTP